MANTQSSFGELEIAHVLFLDLVGYSLEPMSEQSRLLSILHGLLRKTAAFARAERDQELLRLPTGDGMALVFWRNPVEPVECAVELSRCLQAQPSLKLRMGIHSGPVQRIEDINSSVNVAGTAMNLAQRVMDCGDAGHILMSSVVADLLRQAGLWLDHLRDLGLCTVKHGQRLRLFSLQGSDFGNPALPARLLMRSTEPVLFTRNAAPRLVLLHQKDLETDHALANQLRTELAGLGARVFVHRQIGPGLDWVQEVEQEIRSADAVVILLSEGAAHSETLASEVQTAREAAQQHGGKPRLIPVWIRAAGMVSTELGAMLAQIHYLRWDDRESAGALARQLLAALENRDAGVLVPPEQIEPPGGAVPLDSKFYVERTTDVALVQALGRGDSIVLLKGARQMGKTSLLARGLRRSRQAGATVVLTDFQKLNAADLQTPDALFQGLAQAMADQLDLDEPPAAAWKPLRGPSVNFERFLRRQVLGAISSPLVWGLDEVDRLFTCSFASEVFGLFRSWHNERALDPAGPWSRLTLVIAYATEAHLFITDVNQSPFNVGTRLALQDFSPEQVWDLNLRHGAPLGGEIEAARFYRLVGGQPFLVRCGLRELVARQLTIDGFEEQALRDDGLFGDHLRRMLVLLGKDAALRDAVRAVLRGLPCPDAESFYRLRSAGVMAGDSPHEVRLRCQLYATFLERHLR
jgi:class 3 adenylate cyclase